MKITDILETDEWEDEEDYSNLPSIEGVRKLRPQIIQKIQQVYNNWDEEDVDTYAGGGICHFFADEISEVLDNAGYEVSGYQDSEVQHVATLVLTREGVYLVDIPYCIYEKGGGYSWSKIHDVEFGVDDITFFRVDADPGSWENYGEY